MRGPGIQSTDPRMRTVPRFYYDATRDSASGTIYLKVVNPTDAPLPVHVKITGVSSIEPTGQIGEVKGTDPLELNTITDREKIVSTMSKADGLGTDFTRDLRAVFRHRFKSQRKVTYFKSTIERSSSQELRRGAGNDLRFTADIRGDISV